MAVSKGSDQEGGRAQTDSLDELPGVVSSEGEAASARGATADASDADTQPPAESPADESPEEEPEDDGDQSEQKDAVAVRPNGAPIWVAVLTIAGLALVYLGERVLLDNPTGQWIASGLGVLAVLAATVLRFSPRFRGSGELRSIARLLATLTLVTLGSLVVYSLTTDWAAERLSLASLAPETRERILSLLTIGWIVLLVGSLVPMLFGEAAMYPMRRAVRPESRRVRAAVVSGLALVLAAIYGSLFVFVARSAELKVDYSYFKTSEPSESTRKVAEALKEPVTVYAFFPPVNEVRSEVEDYLRPLAAAHKTLEVKVEDRLLVPKRARELGARKDGVIVLVRDKVRERLTIGSDLKEARPKLRTLDRDFQQHLLKFVRSQRVAYLTAGHGELNDRGRRRGERFDPGKGVKEVLRLLNYRIKDTSMARGLAREVPDDADLVMILGPSEPFTGAEIDSLDRYAKAGGRLFIAFDPDALPQSELGQAKLQSPADKAAPAAQDAAGRAPAAAASQTPAGQKPQKPRVAKAQDASAAAPPAPVGPTAVGEIASRRDPHQALGKLVGLKFDPTLLANERWHYPLRHAKSDRILLGTNRYSSHASVSTLSRNSNKLFALLIGAGSLDPIPGAKSKVDFALRTMPSTFADANRNFQFDRGQEETAAFNVGAAVTLPVSKAAAAAAQDKKPEAKAHDHHHHHHDHEAAAESKEDESPPKEMRAFVLADAGGLATDVLGGYPPNQYLLADAIRWLGGEESFAGEVNSEEDVRIEHTKQEDLVWFYSTIFGVPAVVLGVGLFVARSSRRRQTRRSRPTKGGAK